MFLTREISDFLAAICCFKASPAIYPSHLENMAKNLTVPNQSNVPLEGGAEVVSGNNVINQNLDVLEAKSTTRNATLFVLGGLILTKLVTPAFSAEKMLPPAIGQTVGNVGQQVFQVASLPSSKINTERTGYKVKIEGDPNLVESHTVAETRFDAKGTGDLIEVTATHTEGKFSETHTLTNAEWAGVLSCNTVDELNNLDVFKKFEKFTGSGGGDEMGMSVDELFDNAIAVSNADSDTKVVAFDQRTKKSKQNIVAIKTNGKAARTAIDQEMIQSARELVQAATLDNPEVVYNQLPKEIQFGQAEIRVSSTEELRKELRAAVEIQQNGPDGQPIEDKKDLKLLDSMKLLELVENKEVNEVNYIAFVYFLKAHNFFSGDKGSFGPLGETEPLTRAQNMELVKILEKAGLTEKLRAQGVLFEDLWKEPGF